jgi:atypical dual specificity phosphatase
MIDKVQQSLGPALRDGLPFIASVLCAPTGAVLVHCAHGASRSASVVAAHLMSTRGWTAAETLAYLREQRPVVRPNEGFVNQLEVWEEAMRQMRVGAVQSISISRAQGAQ